jgi:hypothetical protein
MKNFILLFSLFFSMNTFSSISVDVISAHYPVADHEGKNTLCVTVVRIPTGNILGIVENIEDCFYARKVKRTGAATLRMSLRSLTKISGNNLQQHLQRLDRELEFYYSGE